MVTPSAPLVTLVATFDDRSFDAATPTSLALEGSPGHQPRGAVGRGCYGPGVADQDDQTRQKLTTVFGWVAGGSIGVLANWGLFVAIGEGYPVTWTTFALFLGGAFAGMYVADKLGPRGFRPLGIAAGVLFAVFIGVVLTVTMGGSRP